MPKAASEMAPHDYLRLIVMGYPKCGKTYTTLETCEKPAYVINCDDESSLRPALRVTSDFVYDEVFGTSDALLGSMDAAISHARQGAREGKYKTIILDTLSSYARNLKAVLDKKYDSGKGTDGRKMWPAYESNLFSVVQKLKNIPAHVIILTHYAKVGGEEGAEVKDGAQITGIVPAISGKAQQSVAGLFQDIVFFEKRVLGGKEQRFFVTSMAGVYGPGCRNLPGVSEVPANISELQKLIVDRSSKKA